jgi:hypothetical protein
MESKPTPRDREPTEREPQEGEPEWFDPPEDFDPERFVESAPWRFAKTMPHIPHWYTVRGQTPDEDFEAFVNYIRKHGYRARWGRRVNTYYELGEWKYWTMGAPVAETIIINRERLKDSTTKPLDSESDSD